MCVKFFLIAKVLTLQCIRLTFKIIKKATYRQIALLTLETSVKITLY